MTFGKVSVLCNRRSGPVRSRMDRVRRAVESRWPAREIRWWFPASREESLRLVRGAVADGTECVLVCGGDGTAASVGAELAGTDVVLAVLPLGSGNGLARHFRESLRPERAVEQLAAGAVRRMDVGLANGRVFLVTASFGWDAELVRAYDALPFRGVPSYALAGARVLGRRAPAATLRLDGGEPVRIDAPLLLSVGNLAGWGGGAMIDAEADEADGRLELVALPRRRALSALLSLRRVFRCGAKALPHAFFRRFATLRIERPAPGPFQLDGEWIEPSAAIDVSVRHQALRILAPAA